MDDLQTPGSLARLTRDGSSSCVSSLTWKGLQLCREGTIDVSCRHCAVSIALALTFHRKELITLLFSNQIDFSNVTLAKHLDFEERRGPDFNLDKECNEQNYSGVDQSREGQKLSTEGIEVASARGVRSKTALLTSRTLMELLEYVLRNATFPVCAGMFLGLSVEP